MTKTYTHKTILVLVGLSLLLTVPMILHAQEDVSVTETVEVVPVEIVNEPVVEVAEEETAQVGSEEVVVPQEAGAIIEEGEEEQSGDVAQDVPKDIHEVAAGIGPGNPLYVLDTIGERLQLSLTFNKEKRASRALKIAEEKMAELDEMKSQEVISADVPRERFEKAYNHYEERMQEAEAILPELEGERVQAVAQEVAKKRAEHRAALEDQRSALPEDIRATIDQHIDQSIERKKQALEHIKNPVARARVEETIVKHEQVYLEQREKWLEFHDESERVRAEAEVEGANPEDVMKKREALRERFETLQEERRAQFDRVREDVDRERAVIEEENRAQEARLREAGFERPEEAIEAYEALDDAGRTKMREFFGVSEEEAATKLDEIKALREEHGEEWQERLREKMQAEEEMRRGEFDEERKRMEDERAQFDGQFEEGFEGIPPEGFSEEGSGDFDGAPPQGIERRMMPEGFDASLREEGGDGAPQEDSRRLRFFRPRERVDSESSEESAAGEQGERSLDKKPYPEDVLRDVYDRDESVESGRVLERSPLPREEMMRERAEMMRQREQKPQNEENTEGERVERSNPNERMMENRLEFRREEHRDGEQNQPSNMRREEFKREERGEEGSGPRGFMPRGDELQSGSPMMPAPGARGLQGGFDGNPPPAEGGQGNFTSPPAQSGGEPPHENFEGAMQVLQAFMRDPLNLKIRIERRVGAVR